MRRNLAIVTALTVSALAQPLLASPPPDNAIPLSEIVIALENSGEVAYFDEIEWDDEGYWEIEYFGSDGSRVEGRG